MMENQNSGVAAGAQASAGASQMGTSAHSYVDWPSILGGAFVALAVVVLATAFGAALGMTAISADQGEASSGLLGLIISTLWIVLSMIAAYALGGYIAGRMRRRVDAATAEEVTVRDGLNGLVSWALGIVLSAILLGSLVSTAISTAGSVAATGAEVAGAAAGGAMTAAVALVPEMETADPMTFVTGTLLRPTTVQPGADAGQAGIADAASILSNMVATGEISDSDRAYLMQLAAARSGLTPAEVEERVDQAVNAAQSVRDEAGRLAQEAEQAVRDAAETARISAILTAFLLAATSLVAAAAAYICAVKGGRHRDEGRIFGGLAYRR